MEPLSAIGFMMAGASITMAVVLYLSRDPSSSNPKLWQVGEHRVKKTTKRLHPMDDPGYRGHKPPKKKCYQCIDCGQVGKYRPRFKSKPCYEVVE